MLRVSAPHGQNYNKNKVSYSFTIIHSYIYIYIRCFLVNDVKLGENLTFLLSLAVSLSLSLSLSPFLISTLVSLAVPLSHTQTQYTLYLSIPPVFLVNGASYIGIKSPSFIALSLSHTLILSISLSFRCFLENDANYIGGKTYTHKLSLSHKHTHTLSVSLTHSLPPSLSLRCFLVNDASYIGGKNIHTQTLSLSHKHTPTLSVSHTLTSSISLPPVFSGK